jgi:hypothetical protein
MGTRRSGRLDRQARGQRAKEDQVLSNLRRAVALAASAVMPALPVLVLVVVGAKRW